ncbi:murein biosynthesis integral membrane protein MurJ [Sphingosinicellaceae bacterium A1X5R2]|nr:murein biosynthesis integral membrane protein MurJ [Pedomonas mirosovicensis]MCH8683969.1 murein biosynthesis integral membrane protein MurJ [Pedomonas mirosovicensis]
MRKQISRVASWTMVSRIAGFVRDIIMAAVLGAGPVADAFLVAFRLPNHFRAIFAEGAVTTAYVPAYARVRAQEGAEAARRFADSVFGWQLVAQGLLLGAALIATPWLITLLAPGFVDDPAKFALAGELTRITFPSLLLISCMTLLSGSLNAVEKFAAAAAAPVLMNLCMIAGLLAWRWFPTVGHAAAWGVLASGLAQFLLVWWAARRAGVGPRLARPRLDEDTRRFFRALGPAVIGSMGVQVAMFADTIIASFLSDGALAALYYADRINQLPIGVIGIAAGTVVLPQMSKKLAEGDEAGARAAQNRAMEFTLLLAAPCVVAFLMIPDLIMTALFQRGKFDAMAAAAAGGTLAAYAVGLVAFVLIRSAVASFYARGGHQNAPLCLAHRHCRQRGAEGGADGTAGAGGAGAGHVRRRVDQRGAGDFPCSPQGLLRTGCPVQAQRRHRCARRARPWPRAVGRQHVAAPPDAAPARLPGGSDARHHGRGGRRGLRRRGLARPQSPATRSLTSSASLRMAGPPRPISRPTPKASLRIMTHLLLLAASRLSQGLRWHVRNELVGPIPRPLISRFGNNRWN